MQACARFCVHLCAAFSHSIHSIHFFFHFFFIFISAIKCSRGNTRGPEEIMIYRINAVRCFSAFRNMASCCIHKRYRRHNTTINQKNNNSNDYYKSRNKSIIIINIYAYNFIMAVKPARTATETNILIISCNVFIFSVLLGYFFLAVHYSRCFN